MLYSHLFSFFFRRVLLVCARERVIHSVEIGQTRPFWGKKHVQRRTKLAKRWLILINVDKMDSDSFLCLSKKANQMTMNFYNRCAQKVICGLNGVCL